MNRYKWLAQYVLRMRNKEETVLVHKSVFGIIHSLPRLTLVREYDFLGDDYYLKINTCVRDFFPKVKTFRISKTNYELILRSFK